MDEHSPDHLQIIGQLAREYEEKYKELETFISQVPPEKIISQLQGLAERSTDRFRSAQVALFSAPDIFDGEQRQHALMAATAMCRAFDEMRILFQFFLENRPK